MEGLTTKNAELLSTFWQYKKRIGKAQPATIEKYDGYLVPFLGWVGDRDLGEIPTREIEFGYLGDWERRFVERYGREPSPATVNIHITALRSLGEFLERKEFIDRDPLRRIDLPLRPQRKNDWLTEDEDIALLDEPRTPAERIVINWLRFTGMRIDEATHVQWRDVVNDEIIVRKSKTPSGLRRIPILPELPAELRRWREHQEARGAAGLNTPVLSTASGTPMTQFQAWKIVKRVACRAGVRPRIPLDRAGLNVSEITPHTLRRTFGSTLLNHGVRLEAVSKLLGHSNTKVTEDSYAELLSATVAREVLAVF